MPRARNSLEGDSRPGTAWNPAALGPGLVTTLGGQPCIMEAYTDGVTKGQMLRLGKLGQEVGDREHGDPAAEQ